MTVLMDHHFSTQLISQLINYTDKINVEIMLTDSPDNIWTDSRLIFQKLKGLNYIKH